MKKIFYLIIFMLPVLSLFHPVIVQAVSDPEIVVLTVDDEIINPIISEYITNGIDKAKDINAEAVIIKIDTPGGLLSSTRTIVKKIMEDEIPVITYVTPKGARAASAGTFITLASNIAVMTPSTHIGAAHPVTMGGSGSFRKKISKKIKKISDQEDDSDNKKKGTNKSEQNNKVLESSSTMDEKIINDTVAWVKNIAKARDKNSDWAVKSVKMSDSISEEEALEKNVIDFIAEDINELLEKVDDKEIILNSGNKILNTKDAEFVDIKMSLREKVLTTISHPNIAYIFMILGFYALLFEITHPGFGVPGIAGLICLILAFYSFQVLPLNFAGLALIILSIILFTSEAFTPTFGLLTIGGILCMVVGSLILIDSPYRFMQVSLKVILPVVIATGGISLFLVGNAIKAYKSKITSGQEGLVEEIGEVKENFSDKKGKVFVHGEIWNGVSETDESIKKGEKVEVVKVEGLKLIVRKHELS